MWRERERERESEKDYEKESKRVGRGFDLKEEEDEKIT